MRVYGVLLGGCFLLSSTLPAMADGHMAVANFAGDWGDATGRLACADDGEYLQFQEDGQVMIVEGDNSEAVAQLADEGDGTMIMTLLEDGGDVALILSPEEDGSLAIIGALVTGVPHAEALADFQSRHEAWVPCP
jgi:hypothetical protein